MSKQSIEVADILKAHIGDYQKTYRMPKAHYKIVYDILSCRTSYLGGHVERCNHCGEERVAYNSCFNRHCPKCQCLAKERWLEKRKAELLPVRYFHTVFTVPHDINPVILCNKRIMLNHLFTSVSETLLQFGLNPKNKLGGRLGCILFLHTWDQKLMDHFHIHCLIPGGVLTEDGKQWVVCSKNYLFSEKALARLFRGKFMAKLKQSWQQRELVFPGNTRTTGTTIGFKNLENKLWSKNWVIDIEDPIDKPEHVLEYVGRYTHRVAISNNRIITLKDGKVTFTYKDRRKKKTKHITMDAVEFIRRFLLHVLPKKFMRIRHIGFLANRSKKESLKRCRQLLGVADTNAQSDKTVQEMMLKLTGKDITLCPKCKKGKFKMIKEIPELTGINPFEIIHRPIVRNTG